jgi:hypothetical protein
LSKSSSLPSERHYQGDAETVSFALSFEPLEQYLQTQEAMTFAASQPIVQSGQDQDALMDMLEGKGDKKNGPGLKRKGSEKGSRAQEVGRSSIDGRRLQLTGSFLGVKKGQHEQDAKADHIFHQEEDGLTMMVDVAL